jgi:transcription-repair coupling factor (superfamily II helicase)
MSKANPIDLTTDKKWLLAHSDRLIAYEYVRMAQSNSHVEMFPDELADRIGRPKEYVTNIIKNALSHAKECYHGEQAYARNKVAARPYIR